MNDNAKMWINALRVGNYKQGAGSLRQGERYCCLGVACEVYRQATGLGRWGNSEAFYASYGDESSSVELIDEVVAWLDLYGKGDETDDDTEPGFKTLGYLNDHLGFSFAQIADELEKNSTSYFPEDKND